MNNAGTIENKTVTSNACSDLYSELISVLKQDDRYFATDGELLRNAVYESAMKMDSNLLKLLYRNDAVRERFFTNIDGISVFDKVSFGWVINNREFLPDSYTRYKNKIGLTNRNGDYISTSNDVELVFPYKDCTLEGGQTNDDQRRNEVFYNETLAPDEVDRLLSPKVFTNAKRCSKNGEEKVAAVSNTDNLIIKGNNLLAIHSLLTKYRGKVKCIYIDPPYYFKESKATDTFKYNSNFHLSTWLVFMKDRLLAAKQLLMQGGTIWISIGEDGMHYLKVLADDIFGADHFIGTIPRRTRNGKSDVPFNFSQDFDWILAYTNTPDDEAVVGRRVERKYYESPDFPGKPWRLADLTSQQPASKRANSYFTMVDPKTGKEYPASEKRTWAVTKDTFKDYYAAGAIVFPDDYDFLNITKPYARKFKFEDDNSGKLSSIFSDFAMQDFLKTLLFDCKNKDGNTQIDELFGRDEFDYAKPEKLIKSILDIATEEGDLVMDFFLGSGTTCAVAHKMNRRYIGIDQMDYIERLAVERLKKVIEGEQGGVSGDVKWSGGGSFIYCELAKLNQSFIERICSANESELVDIWTEMQNTGFISHKVDPRSVVASATEFTALAFSDKKRILLELLDKNQLYVNYCDMEDETFAILEEDKAFNNNFYRES